MQSCKYIFPNLRKFVGVWLLAPGSDPFLPVIFMAGEVNVCPCLAAVEIYGKEGFLPLSPQAQTPRRKGQVDRQTPRGPGSTSTLRLPPLFTTRTN